MDAQDYLMDLINRMSDETWEYVPEEDMQRRTIREKAVEEANGLTNISYIQPLKELINQYSNNTMKEKRIRSRIYSILESIAINTGNTAVYEYFTDRLNKETDKDLIGDSLLLYIIRSSYIPKLYKILPLIEDNRWQVRYGLITLLGKYSKKEVEDVLLPLLDKSKDIYEITHLLKSLRNIQSVKVLDRIEKFLNHDKGEIRASAIATLSHILGEKALPIFIKALKEDRSRDVKLNALYAIIFHGDESVVPLLLERIKKILKTKRKIEPLRSEDSDVVSIIKFLLKYPHNEEVITLLNWIRKKKWDYLFENEQKWFNDHILE